MVSSLNEATVKGDILDQFEAVNCALNDAIFSGKYGNRPVYVTLGQHGREELALYLRVDPDEVEETICEIVGEYLRPKGNPYANLASKKDRWLQESPHSKPPFTALLFTLAHAAELMHADGEFSATNYYQRLHQITGIDPEKLSQYGRETTQFWEALNRWLRETDYEYGYPTADPLGAWKHVGYSLSQAVLRLADLEKFKGMFERYGFTGSEQISETEIIQYIDDWMTTSGPNSRLRKVWSKEELRPRIAQAALEGLSDWSNETNYQLGSSGTYLSRRLSIVATLAKFPTKFFSMSFVLKAELETDIENLSLFDDAANQPEGGQGFALENNGLYGGLGMLGPDSLVNLPALLIDGIELFDNEKKRKFTYTPNLIIPFVKSENGSHWNEISRLPFNCPTILLCRDKPKIRQLVNELLTKCAIPGQYSWATPAELKGIPDGWVLYQGIELIQMPDNCLDDIQALMPLSSAVSLQSRGGIRLERGIWHKDAPPSFVFTSDAGPTKIKILKEDGEGHFECVDEVSSNDPVCEYQNDNDIFNEESNYIAQAFKGVVKKPIAKLSILLRSAEKPRKLHLQDKGLLSYRSIASASEKVNEETVAVSGHFVNSDDLPTLINDSSLLQCDSKTEGHSEVFLIPAAVTSKLQDDKEGSCVSRGFHTWKCEAYDARPNSSGYRKSRNAPMQMECTNCGKEVIARNRTKKTITSTASQSAMSQPPSFSNSFASQEIVNECFDPDIVLDALCFLGSGSWGKFENIALNETLQPWSSTGIANDLAALGFIDISCSMGGNRISAWSVTPPALVVCPDNSAFLSGFRNQSMITQASEVIKSIGADVTISSDNFNQPAIIRAKNFDVDKITEALNEVKGPHMRPVAVLKDAAYQISAACLKFGTLSNTLQSAHISLQNEFEKFDLKSGNWQKCINLNESGAYRFQYIGRKYFYKSQQEKTYIGPYEVVKLLAARDAGFFLHSYNAETQEFISMLGCEPIGLLKRALVACSGELPDKTTVKGMAVYKNVPPDIASSILEVMYKKEHLP